jgi:hypothetical protein
MLFDVQYIFSVTSHFIERGSPYIIHIRIQNKMTLTLLTHLLTHSLHGAGYYLKS